MTIEQLRSEWHPLQPLFVPRHEAFHALLSIFITNDPKAFVYRSDKWILLTRKSNSRACASKLGRWWAGIMRDLHSRFIGLRECIPATTKTIPSFAMTAYGH